MKRRSFVQALAAATVGSFGPVAWAQEAWPTKPVRLIVGLAPGGLADIAARLIAPGLGAELGQPFVVENLVGAGGVNAAQTVARSTPDGYTLMLSLDATMCITPALRVVPTPFEMLKDFAFMGRVLQAPLVIFASEEFAANNVADLVRLGKSPENHLFYGSAGVGSSGHVAGEYLKALAGFDMTHVPYRGAGEALTDTVSGKINMYISTAPSGMEFVKTGQLKVLGNTGSVRTPELPDVPTLAESGVPALKGFDLQAWAGVLAPAGTPPAIVAKVNTALRKVVGDPALADRFRVLGVTSGVTSPDEMRAQIALETERWRKLGKDAKIELQ